MAVVDFAIAFGQVLGALVAVIFWLVIIWGIAQLVIVARDFRGKLQDEIALDRGIIKAIAKEKEIDMVYEITKSGREKRLAILDRLRGKQGKSLKEFKK